MTELCRFYKLAEEAIIANKPLRARMLLSWPLDQLEAKKSQGDLISVQILEIEVSMHDLRANWTTPWVRESTLTTIRYLIEGEQGLN